MQQHLQAKDESEDHGEESYLRLDYGSEETGGAESLWVKGETKKKEGKDRGRKNSKEGTQGEKRSKKGCKGSIKRQKM